MSILYEADVYVQARNEGSIKDYTVIQKILTPKEAEAYITGTKKNVTGWVSKAAKVAPYTKCVKDIYVNLHLDYPTSIFTKVLKDGEGIHILRCTTCKHPYEAGGPRVNLGKHPDSMEIGEQGEDAILIPEYNYGTGFRIRDGVISYLDSNAQESVIAIWNMRKQRFESVEGKEQ